MSKNLTLRQHEIFQLVEKRGFCGIQELAKELNVSGETIRRNVKKLSNEGFVIKVHGGISSPIQKQEPPILSRMRRMVAEKKRIAEKVAEQIKDGESLIIDTGSTTAFCAQALQNHANLTVITNSSYIANQLASRNGNRVFMAGGELRSHDAAAFGPSVINFVESFQVDKSILSIGAVHNEKGCMNFELCEAEFSRSVIKQSDHIILATDDSKFDKSGVACVCQLGEIDTLITNRMPENKLRIQLQNANVVIQLA